MDREIHLPLDFLYSFMGWVAFHAGHMSRQSINFIPSNVVLIGLAPLICLICLIAYTGQIWILLLGVLSALMFVLLIISSLIKHTVFQRKRSSSATAQTLENFDGEVLFNGKLRLSEKMFNRFLGVLARIVTLEDGSLGFASLIDASTTMYGFVLSEQRGVWYSVPMPGSLEITDGVFYYGAKGHPALRLSYTEKLGPKRRTEVAIVAFSSEAERETARLWFAEKVNPPFDY
ncbi:hypothetical protein IAD21_03668 [Abditibacteriota bacterium]|nr:hypothetical protein IAD21_03668 [Abditibacteriota bacterium]